MTNEIVGGFVLPEEVGCLRPDRPVGGHGAVRGTQASRGLFEEVCEQRGITLGPAVEVDFGERSRLPIRLDPEQAGDIQFTLVEDESGALHWIQMDPASPEVELLREPDLQADPERGLVADATKKVLRWVAFQLPVPDGTIDRFRAFEARVRPNRLLQLDISGRDFVTPEVVPGTTLEGPLLLMLHGTGSSTEVMLAEFQRAQLARLGHGYSHTLAFDHPTLSFSPADNAKALVEKLNELKLGSHEIDVLAHGRGGLVARRLVEGKLLPRDITPRTTVFVGTPNAGTPIADRDHALQLADVLTSPLTFLPDNLVTDTLDLVLEFLKIVAAKALDSLDGLKAQAPDSPFLQSLNGVAASEGQYRSISSAFQGGRGGASGKLYLRLSDLVFDGDSDLVVPTNSTHGPVGEFNIPSTDRLVLRGPDAVNHFDYWKAPAVVEQLFTWFLGAREEPASIRSRMEAERSAMLRSAFQVGDMSTYTALVDEEAASERGAARLLFQDPLTAPAARRSELGTVVVIPGVMGTHLGVGDRRIWIHLIRMLWGRLRDLAMSHGPGDVSTMGLVASYEDLVRHLLGRRHVSLFGYDWRRSLAEAANTLNDHVLQIERDGAPTPISFVAHSMGGLVVRTFIKHHPDTWNGLGEHSRAVLLGTPNLGSHEMVRNLIGDDPNLRRIARFSPLSLEETAAIVRSMPGVLQLLPRWGEGQLDLLADETWLAILDNLDALTDGSLPAGMQTNLGTARTVLADLDDQYSSPGFADDGRLLMVAGTGHATPTATQLEVDGSLSWADTRAGDGTVPVELAAFPGGRATYYSSADHGGLAEDPDVFEAVDDLLHQGKTSKLDDKHLVMERGPRC